MYLKLVRRRGQTIRIVDHFSGRVIELRPVHFRSGRDGGRFTVEVHAPGCTVERIDSAPDEAKIGA